MKNFKTRLLGVSGIFAVAVSAYAGNFVSVAGRGFETNVSRALNAADCRTLIINAGGLCNQACSRANNKIADQSEACRQETCYPQFAKDARACMERYPETKTIQDFYWPNIPNPEHRPPIGQNSGTSQAAKGKVVSSNGSQPAAAEAPAEAASGVAAEAR